MSQQAAMPAGGSFAAEDEVRTGRTRRGRAQRGGQPGVFDFYLLTLSWAPEYCATHPGSTECAGGTGFVLHGLWPQNNDGTYPENCSNAAGPANPGELTGIMPTASLVEHEWTTHGTCTGLAPEAWVSSLEQAFAEVKVPAGFGTTAATVAPGVVLSEFAGANPGFPAGSLALSCGGNELTAVEVCLSKSLQPQACSAVKTCGATSVGIVAR